MAALQVVSPAEYRAARLELLVKEKEITRAQSALTQLRQTLPVTEVTEQYKFTTQDDHGNPKEITLADLFDGRRQLIVYHFMFDPAWEVGCEHCSVLGDTIPTHLQHLHARSTTFVIVSRAPIQKIAAYKKRMGWTFPWVSSHGSDFNYDFKVTQDESRGPNDYNFKTPEEIVEMKKKGLGDRIGWGELNGTSCFIAGDGEKIGEEGKVYHTYSAYARGAEHLVNIWQWMGMTKLGQRHEYPDKRFDEYLEEELTRFE